MVVNISRRNKGPYLRIFISLLEQKSISRWCFLRLILWRI